MAPAKVNYKQLLERIRKRKLTERDYQVLANELQKVVRTGAKKTPRRVVAKLPFGMDIVK